jgi:hypothetical protein
MTDDEAVNALAAAHANGHAVGAAEERGKWVKAIAEERRTLLTIGPPRRRRAPDAALRAVLARLGIMQ